MTAPAVFLTVAIVALAPLGGCRRSAAERIVLMPVEGKMMVNARVPQLDGRVFGLGIPETIGSAEKMWLVNHPDVTIHWEMEERDGRAQTTWEEEGSLRYDLQLIPAEDFVDIVITIRNQSATAWHDVFAFNCVSPARAPDLRDSTLHRTYMSIDGRATPLADVPRATGPRPNVTVYPTRSHAERLPPFARAFQATSPAHSDGSWLVVVSEAGDAFMATTTPDAAFLFSNTAFGCIHAVPSFGDIAPGDESTVRSRAFFSKGDLGEFLRRYESYRDRRNP